MASDSSEPSTSDAPLDWDELHSLVDRMSESGVGPGSFTETDWKSFAEAIEHLEAQEDEEGMIRLRKLMVPLYARDSVTGLPILEHIDHASIDAAKRLSRHADLGHFWGARGHNLHRQGFHQAALEAFENSITHYREVDMRFRALKSLHMQSLCYRALGDVAAAKRVLQEVLAQTDPDDPWRGNPLQVLAWIRRDEGDLEQAETLLQEAIRLHRAGTESDLLVAGTLADLGEINRLQKRYAQAEAHFNESLRIISQYSGQYNRLEARTKTKYAELLIRQREWDRAMQMLNDADRLASMYGRYYDSLWRIELNFAYLYFRRLSIGLGFRKLRSGLRYRRALGVSTSEIVMRVAARAWNVIKVRVRGSLFLLM